MPRRIEVRRARVEDGETLRRVRLAALAESPSAFGSTYTAEADRPPTEWAERARAGATSDDRVTFFALAGDDVVGLVGGYREPDAPTIDLVSMWVAPSHRRDGVGRMLVAAVLEWAEHRGAPSVELWVTRGNDAAHALYESMGFVDTDDVQPLPSDPCKDEVRMIWERSPGK